MVDHIVNMEPLNRRKPTELLAAMSKYRPADNKHFFAYHFLQRLPREVRVLLSRKQVENMQVLAEKADLAAVAASEEGDEDTAITDIKKGAVSKRSSGKKRSGKPKRQRSCSNSTERCSPLCWLQIPFGNRARQCEQSCAWPAVQEN
jgi:hypothetical protein